MPFLGTIINFSAVFIAGTLGALIKKGIPKRISDSVMAAIAFFVIYIGVDGMLEKPPAVPEGTFLSAGLLKTLIIIISMLIGVIIGEIINFDALITKLGDFLENKTSRFLSKGEERGNFAKGFVTCSLLFCVGAMAVNGALGDALGKPDILLAKTVIDTITCFITATTLGIGCAFSAFFVLIYQGAITLFGLFLTNVASPEVLTYMSVVGSLIIIPVGTNVLGLTKIKTANMLPAMFMPIWLYPLFELIFF